MRHYLSEGELRKVQLVQLELLQEVDRICKKCDIQYNIIAGTLLGAVRHGGYIPWDDDADVALLRDEYEKFRAACETELDTTRFYFQDHRNTPGYRWGYGKLRRKETLFLRENQEHMPYEQGIFIDVFPLDGIGNNYRESIRNFRKVEGWYNFLLTRTCGIRQGRSFVKNLAVRIMRCIPQSMINDSKLLCKVDELCSRQSYKENKYVASLLGAYGKREIVPKEIIGEPTLCHFEDVEVYGVQQPDHYLSHLYGDWRKLPPVEKQVSHHDYLYLSFDESYLKA